MQLHCACIRQLLRLSPTTDAAVPLLNHIVQSVQGLLYRRQSALVLRSTVPLHSRDDLLRDLVLQLLTFLHFVRLGQDIGGLGLLS